MHRAILILTILAIGGVDALRQRRQANGCGTGSFVTDGSLKVVRKEVIIPCCNQHDLCYDTCGEN
jgi:hypothetical protein